MRIFVVSGGGGAKGRVQLPSYRGIIKQYGSLRAVTRFYGTSIGALHSSFLAQDDLASIEQLWADVEARDDHEAWNGIHGMTTLAVLRPARGGIFSQDPLRAVLDRKLKLAKIVVPCTVGAVDAGTEAYLDLRSEDAQTDKEWRDYIQASASIAGVFCTPPPVRGRQLIDGGHKLGTCVLPSDLVAGDRVHIITCSPLPGTHEHKTIDSLTERLSLIVSIWENDAMRRSMEDWKDAAHKGAEILIHAPAESTGSMLLADAASIQKRERLGQWAWANPIKL